MSAFRVLNDASYDRMLRKLERGSAWEWSFKSLKCEKDTDGNCICNKNMNVLSRTEPGRIVRIEDGKQIPVYRAREASPHIAALGGSTTAKVNLHLSLMLGTNHMRYAADISSMLRNMANSGVKTIDLGIFLDDVGMSGKCMAVEIPIDSMDKIHDMIVGARAAHANNTGLWAVVE